MSYYETVIPTYEEMQTWYPRFYDDIYEMQEILKVQAYALDESVSAVEKLYSNMFIDTMDEEILNRLFIFFDLTTSETDNVETKRRILKSYISGLGKISADSLNDIVKQYTGEDADISFYAFDEAGNNRLDISCNRGDKDTVYFSDLYNLIARRLPAHIVFRVLVGRYFSIVTSVKQAAYTFEHDLCGTKHEIATLGLSVKDYDIETAAVAMNCVPFDHVLCGTTSL